jgi:hypothetical protein
MELENEILGLRGRIQAWGLVTAAPESIFLVA